jgi:Heavy metal associated domain 2
MADDRIRVVHHCEGRLRVKAERLRGSAVLAESVVESLTRETGVLEARVSATTGSLIIRYDTHILQLPRLIHAVLEAGGWSGVAVDAPLFGLPTMAGGDRIRAALAKVNETLELETGGKLDMRTAVPGTLAGLGLLFFLFRSRRIPEWYDLFFWSFVTFVNLNPARTAEPPWHVPRG